MSNENEKPTPTPADAFEALRAALEVIERAVGSEVAASAVIAMGTITVNALDPLERRLRVVNVAGDLVRKFDRALHGHAAEA